MNKFAFFLLVCSGLTACGGGSSNPTVSEVSVRSLKFSQSAEIYVAGKYLRADLQLDSPGCTNPRFAANSTAELAILNCTATVVGAIPLTMRAPGGEVVFSTTLTVPQPQVTLLTQSGTVVLELDPQRAPLSVNNFLSYVNRGYYAGTLFHRVIPGFVVQAGGYTTGLKEKPGLAAPIALESNNGLLNTRGTLAMARTNEPNSATSQFFFNLVDNKFLDFSSASNPGYAVFGKVTQGLDVVDAIAAVPTASASGFANVPVTDITINFALQTR